MAKMQPYVPPPPTTDGDVDLKYIIKNGKRFQEFGKDIEYTRKKKCHGYAIEAKNGEDWGVLYFIPFVNLDRR